MILAPEEETLARQRGPRARNRVDALFAGFRAPECAFGGPEVAARDAGRAHRALRVLVFLSASSLVAAMAGCGMARVGSSASIPVAGVKLRGAVYGGLQPIGFSQLQMYAPGQTGYASAALPLFRTPITTDSGGNFNFTGDYSCPSAATPVYLVVTGGNPGLSAGSNNAALSLMSFMGLCGDLGPSTFVMVNEVTTVAAVYALQPFMTGPAAVGAPPSNQQGLLNAFTTIASLVSPGGVTPGSSPAIATVPSAEINTLADAVSSCVNSNGDLSLGTACGRLFAAATPPGGAPPTDTISALTNIARNPGHNASAIFKSVAASPPYQPTLATAPSDWALAINYLAPAFATPTDIAIDSAGTVWVLSAPGTANTGSSTVTALTLGGITATFPQTLANFGNMAIDQFDNLWLTDTNLSNVVELTSSGTRASGAFTGGGIQGPGPIAFDSAGDAWVVNNSASISELSPSGVSMSPASGFSTGGAHGPVALAIDAAGNIWTADGAGDTVSKLIHSGQQAAGSPYSGNGLSGPFALTLDAAGEAIVANRTASTLTRFTLPGVSPTSVSYSGAGLNGPIALAVDGGGTVWVANGSANTISEIPLASAGGVGESGTIGYGLAALTNPYKLAVDASGNLWVMNLGTRVAGSGTITQVVGVASPVITPVSMAVKTNSIGLRP